MIKDIIKFSSILRENGIPASVRSTKSACESIPLIKNNEANLKLVLSSIYIKNYRQKDKFDKLYESFFQGDGVLKSKQLEEKKSTKSYSTQSSLNTKISYKTTNYQLNSMMDTLSTDQKIVYLENTLGGKTSPNNKDINPNLLQNNLKCLNTPQSELIELCQQLGRKLASKRARRNKIAKKQKTDIRKSIRKNLKNGGILMELIRINLNLKNKIITF
jgi:uncharacterized protein